MGKIRGKLDSLYPPRILQLHLHRHPNSRSITLPHFFRYMSRLCPFVFAGYLYCDNTGSQAWVYGSVLNTNQTEDFPTANYVVDGTPGKLVNRISPQSLTAWCNSRPSNTVLLFFTAHLLPDTEAAGRHSHYQHHGDCGKQH